MVPSFFMQVCRKTRPAQDFVTNALPAARLLLVLGRGVCVRSPQDAPGAPKQLASLSLKQVGQLGIMPSGNGTGMQLSGGACLSCEHAGSAAGTVGHGLAVLFCCSPWSGSLAAGARKHNSLYHTRKGSKPRQST